MQHRWSDMSWDDVQNLPTGELVHLMNVLYVAYQEDSYHMQCSEYIAAVDELDRRFSKNES